MNSRSASIGSLQGIALAAALVLTPRAYAISAVDVQIGHMESAAGEARNVSLHVRLKPENFQLSPELSKNTYFAQPQPLKPGLQISGQIKTAKDAGWTDASLVCNTLLTPFSASKNLHPAKRPAQYQRQYQSQKLALGQEWQCGQGRLVTAHINVPFSLVVTTQQAARQPQFNVQLNLTNASLSDAAGLHAGEKITATLMANAARQQQAWAWEAHLDWLAGELFWQPFYFASAGHRLDITGALDDETFTVKRADLKLNQVGTAQFDGQLRIQDRQWQEMNLQATGLNLATLHPLLLRPVLEKTALNNVEMEGTADLQLSILHGEPESFLLNIHEADIADKNGRFALYKLNASIPWSYQQITTAKLAYAGGSLLKIPLGAASLQAELNRYALTASRLTLPILDGALNLSDISAAWVNDQWHWHLQASILPIDMVQLSQSLGLPRMEGKVAASIPMVTYTDGQLTVDGAMGFNLFNGSILVNRLSMQQPLGNAPKLSADLQMRNLDLGALTRTFAFGAIEGKLDGDVSDLQLLNWKPVNMDASFHSSPGHYPKKISQRAVENISALGGAGAAAAIQRSFLRFLKEFNYQEIGLGCRLRGDICHMDGVQSTPQGYVIVKGSGLPSITVMGYNHTVSWTDLVARIQRIIAGNVKPLIQ